MPVAVAIGGVGGEEGRFGELGLGMRGGHQELPVNSRPGSVAAANRAVDAAVAGMSYDQLLTTFGDGGENRGADPSVISSLPTHVIDNVEKELPEDKRECPICLETFQTGEERKTLPCLHGFHAECVDRWLEGSAACPVCKHAVDD